MWTWASDRLCTLVLLAWMAGTAYPQALSGPGMEPELFHPWNSSGFSVVSLQWLSVQAPFLTTAWISVALFSVLGKQPALA